MMLSFDLHHIVLLVLALLVLAVEAENMNFEDGLLMSDKLEIVKYATLVQGVDALFGAGALEIDSRASEQEWNHCVHTGAGLLKSNTTYVVTIHSHVLKQEEDSYLYFLVRPLSNNSHEFDLATLKVDFSNCPQPRRMRFHVPENVKDYALQIHTRKKVYAMVDKIRIEEGDGRKFYPAAVDVGKTAPESLPTGAKKFIVDAPLPVETKEVVATDFGMSVDSPDNVAALQKAIDKCQEQNASRLVVPKGVYRFTSNDSVKFDSLKDFVFDGQGSKFVFYKQRDALFQISNCERVEFKGFQVDWDWDVDPLGSVVKVHAVNEDGSVDLNFLDYENEKFPREDVRIAAMEELDNVTRKVGCEGCVDMGRVAKTEWLSGNRNRLRLFADPTDQNQMEEFKSKLKINKLFRIRHYVYDMDGFVLNGNAHLTLRDIDIYSCPGHALLSYGDQHHWQFIRVNIIPPPGLQRPITCTADHHHIGQSQGFFLMENCEFSLGGDDCLNVHDNNSGFVYPHGAYTVRSKYLKDISTYKPGDRIEFRNDDFSPTGFYGTLKSVTPIDEDAGIHEFAFEEPIPTPSCSGFVLFNWRFNTRNIIVRNCSFHDNRARGLLLLGRDITIENNTFVRTQMSAIMIQTGYTSNLWAEGYGPSNIVISGNVFDTINPIGANPQEMQPVIYMSVYLKTDPSEEKTMYPILNNILVEANEFRNSPGAIAFVASAANVTIRNNTIRNDVLRKNPSRERGAIGAVYCSDLYVTGNRWINSPEVPVYPGILAEKDTTRDINCNGNAVVDP